MIYCANCDKEAEHKVIHSNKNEVPLCETCKTAYEWGQVSPMSFIVYISENKKEDEK